MKFLLFILSCFLISDVLADEIDEWASLNTAAELQTRIAEMESDLSRSDDIAISVEMTSNISAQTKSETLQKIRQISKITITDTNPHFVLSFFLVPVGEYFACGAAISEAKTTPHPATAKGFPYEMFRGHIVSPGRTDKEAIFRALAEIDVGILEQERKSRQSYRDGVQTTLGIVKQALAKKAANSGR